jgi:hypothetical protein
MKLYKPDDLKAANSIIHEKAEKEPEKTTGNKGLSLLFVLR